MGDIIEYCIQSKHSGELMVGWRVTFMDMVDIDYPANGEAWAVGLLRHHGWVIYSPCAGPVPYYLNTRSAEEYVEILGRV